MLKLPSFLRSILGTHGEIPAKQINSPLFIVGCMRSGTTLLVDKLSTHPQLLKIGSELNDVWTDIGGAKIGATCDYKLAKDANSFFTYQMSNYFFQFIHESRSFKRYLMRANALKNRKTGRIRYDWNNIIPVNKSPHLMNKIGYVDGLFPNSKILLIMRDIHAHSASMKIHFDNESKKRSIQWEYSDEHGTCWSRNNKSDKLDSTNSYPPNFKVIPKMWIKLNHLALNSLRELDSDKYAVIGYEQLINEQSGTYSKIFSFLNLDEKHASVEKQIMGDTVKYKNTTTAGNPLNKWKKTLSPEEINAIDDVIKENQKEYDEVLEMFASLKL
jgi:hypothetical protein